MNNDDTMTFYGFLILAILVLVVSSGVTFFEASNEAAAFNRLSTGPRVTAWDALWLELRVDAKCQ